MGSQKSHEKYRPETSEDQSLYSGYDIAMAVVKLTKGDAPAEFPKIQAGDDDLAGQDLLLAGYPRDKLAGGANVESIYTMCSGSGPILAVAHPEDGSVDQKVFIHEVPVTGGQSGSPYQIDFDDHDVLPNIVGVHAGAVTTKMVKIDK